MKYAVCVAYSVRDEIDRLDARWRSAVLRAMREYLEHEPAKASKSRIKKLKELRQPQYRLRVDDVRIYYDVDDDNMRVEVLGVVLKEQSTKWLNERGVPL